MAEIQVKILGPMGNAIGNIALDESSKAEDIVQGLISNDLLPPADDGFDYGVGLKNSTIMPAGATLAEAGAENYTTLRITRIAKAG